MSRNDYLHVFRGLTGNEFPKIAEPSLAGTFVCKKGPTVLYSGFHRDSFRERKGSGPRRPVC
ncbi:hypothetical protein DLM75_00320 [Leptospira stimsonii]|uniref:Uncharacterized protein n=1 Tax=Leptospira stimsonii TaxID=2202203 RepID=A0A396Z8J9_9LEPT|nr:hypothetical protein DLM75_00320 [Leptospira stimsonii]